MGIPRLARLLQPYGSPIEWTVGDAFDSNEQQRAVIDGPALAHHAYRIALSGRGRARHALEAIPEYHEVCAVATAWLSVLQDHGIEIAAIYFDGRLPEFKRAVRQARLEQSLHQLTTFRSIYSDDLPQLVRTPSGAMSAVEMFSPCSVEARLTMLPPAPFLVPAVLESLCDGALSTAVVVVPGEADAYCAEDVKANNGFVVTSDSDLMVYDLGKKGAVTFFNDFKLDESLTTLVYEPASIAQRMHLSSLTGLAFIVSSNRRKKLGECIQIARKLQSADSAYVSFKAEYQEEVLMPECFGNLSTPNDGPRALYLDPRVSEYILQPGFVRPIMYLPCLLDDPMRFSAWSCGIGIRRLGYGVFLLTRRSSDATTFEVRRRGLKRVAQVPLPTILHTELLTGITDMTTSIEGLKVHLVQVSDTVFWRSFAIAGMIKELKALEKPTPNLSDIKMLMAASSGDYTWTHIHLRACLQAQMYSLRILKQLLNAAFSLQTNSDLLDGQSECLQSLKVCLTSLPDLCALFKPEQVHNDLNAYIRAICDHTMAAEAPSDQLRHPTYLGRASGILSQEAASPKDKSA